MGHFGAGKVQKANLDYQVFIIVCAITAGISTFSLIVDILHKTAPIDLTLDVVALIYFLTVFISLKIKRDHRPFLYPTLFFIFLISPVYWLYIGSIDLTGALFYVGTLLMAILITPTKFRKMVVVGFYTMALLYVVVYIIYGYRKDQVDYEVYVSYVYFLLIVFGIASATLYLKNNYDRERKNVRNFSQSLRELYRLNINEGDSLKNLFSNYLAIGCELLDTDKAMITKKEWNKWRVVRMTGFDEQVNLDHFNKTYTEKITILDSAQVISDTNFQWLGETVGNLIVAPITINGALYGHLIFLWSLPDRQLRGNDLELVEVISQYLGYLIGAEETRGVERKTREALNMSETRFRKIFENANVGIAVADLNGSFLMVNPAFQQLFGYTVEELLQMSFTDISHPEDLALDFSKYKEMVDGKINGYEIEKRNLCKDGTVIQILLRVSLIHDPAGRPLYGIGIIEDITQRKKHEQEIHQLNKELAESIRRLESTNKELESFSYSVSHDLRAPLRAINGFSKILLDEYGPQLDEEGRRLINIVASNAGKMGVLIDDLLSFSRLSRQAKNLEKVGLDELIEGILNDLSVQYNTDGIIEVKSSLPSVYADKNLLRQALINVISNALKFSSTRKTPKVLIDAHSKENNIRVSITDNGVGFNMKYHNKLFKVFQRLHTDKEFAGTGVGLAIVERIIKRHGGRVWAESNPGKGSTFHLDIPSEPVSY